MNTVFFGTPDFSVPSLRALAETTNVKAVITGPDARRGRGKKLKPPPVKEAALELGLPVLQPYSIRDLEFLELMASYELDLGVVVAYGRILGRRLLRTPRLRFVNVHASLLPKLRGAAPIQRAIMEGHDKSGVCIMRMQLGLDKGPVYIRKETDITAEETSGTLHDKLAEIGAQALKEFIAAAIEDNVPNAQIQEHDEATYAEKITSKDEWIDWQQTRRHIDCQIRGLAPRPGACTHFRGQRLRILEASKAQETAGVPAGTIEAPIGTIVLIKKEPYVQCQDGLLKLDKIQLQGKKACAGRDFANGYRLKEGEALFAPDPGEALEGAALNSPKQGKTFNSTETKS